MTGAGSSALLVLALAGVPVVAVPATLNLDEAVALALAASPLVRAANLEAAAARAEAAGVQRLPDLDITVSPSVVGASKDVVTVTQALGGGAQRTARVAAAEAQAAAARAAVAQQAQTLRYEVAVAHANLQAAQATVGLQRRGVAIARRFLSEAQAQFRAGNVPRAQVVRAEIELSSAEQTLAQADAERLIAQMILRRILDPAEQAASPVATALAHGAAPHALAPSIASALTRRAEVKQAEAGLALARAEQALLAAQGWPAIAVSGWLDDQRDPASNLGLSVTTQILPWSFGTLAQQRKAAVARVAASAERLEAARNLVVTEVRAAHGRWDIAQRTASIAERDVVPRSETLLAMSEEGFRRGAHTYLELLDARRMLLSGRTAFIQALLAENTAVAAFVRAVAAPVPLPAEARR